MIDFSQSGGEAFFVGGHAWLVHVVVERVGIGLMGRRRGATGGAG
ncbi:hypothetical protein [Ktedonobacter sp. SOSP1-85]|nr:hypothetical protein [Ktedonobacter sp. SOSP1-85]